MKIMDWVSIGFLLTCILFSFWVLLLLIRCRRDNMPQPMNTATSVQPPAQSARIVFPGLIFQSCRPGYPHWIAQCMDSVKQWAKQNHFGYHWMGDELFSEIPERFRQLPKIIQTDFARLQFLERVLEKTKMEAAYWIDSDILIWDSRFELPVPKPGQVVCSREVWDIGTGTHVLDTNNSIVGFCCADDARILIDHLTKILDRYIEARWDWDDDFYINPTIIGTEAFSKWRFPLRRVPIKSNACFTSAAIDTIAAHGHIDTVGEVCPLMDKLSLLHGGTIRAANLAASRLIQPWKMDQLVGTLMAMPHRELGWYKIFTPFCRAYHHIAYFLHRVRYWVVAHCRS